MQHDGGNLGFVPLLWGAVVLPTCTEGGEWPDRDEMIKIR